LFPAGLPSVVEVDLQVERDGMPIPSPPVFPGKAVSMTTQLFLGRRQPFDAIFVVIVRRRHSPTSFNNLHLL
jgi:hypothetical protein